MTEASAAPVVVFGKLAGFGLLFVGAAALIAAGGFFVSVANAAHENQMPLQAQGSVKHDFQLVQLGDFRRDQFLVDKSTGRVWQSLCSGEVAGPDCKGMLIWDEMYVDGVTPSDSSTARLYFQQVLGRK
jgi:hypothetical protein